MAAVVLAAAAFVGIKTLGTSGSPSTSASRPVSAGSAAPPRATPAGAQATPSAPPSTAAGAASSSATAGSSSATAAGGRAGAVVPTFAGPAQLAATLRRTVPARLPQAATPAGAASRCLAPAERIATRDPRVARASVSFTEAVVLTGVPGQVFVFPGRQGRVAVVVRSGTCSLLATVAF